MNENIRVLFEMGKIEEPNEELAEPVKSGHTSAL